MRLVLAKSEMRCLTCGTSIERNEYFATPGPHCFTCARQKPVSTPTAEPSAAPSLFSDPEREFFEEAKTEIGATRLRFAGATYRPNRDKVRLTKQALRIFQFVRDGRWYTLKEIEAATGDPSPSVSARLRSFKLPEMGGHQLEKRLHSGSTGLWEYRVLVNEESLSDEDKKAA